MADEKEEKGAAAESDAAEKPVKDDKTDKAPASVAPAEGAPETKAASVGKKPAVKAAAAEAAGSAAKPARAEKAPVEKAPAEKAPKEKAAKESKIQTEAGEAAAPARAGGKRKDKKNIPFAIANIHATFNNTVITISDQAGNVLAWSSSGCVGFKGSRKGTPFAAQLAAQTAGNAAREHGVRQVEVRVKGPGSGRESSIRAMQAIGLEIKSIKDVTPIPHNGCRPPKRRRV